MPSSARDNDSRYNDFRIITMRYDGTVDFICRITINSVYRYCKNLASNLAGIVISRRAGSMPMPIISQSLGELVLGYSQELLCPRVHPGNILANINKP